MSVEDSPTSTTDDVVNVGVDSAAEELSKSALADNITKKGKNAYYYAHAHKATGPKWDGKIEPRLLSTSSSNLASSAASSDDDNFKLSINSNNGAGVSSSITSGKAALMAKSNITNYAFLNEESKVKLYVNLPGVGNCSDDSIALEFTEQSLCLTVKNYIAPAEKPKVEEMDELLVADTAPPEKEEEVAEEEGEKNGEDRCLSFGKLYGEIESASFRKKTDKVIVTMKKKDKKVWNKVLA